MMVSMMVATRCRDFIPHKPSTLGGCHIRRDCHHEQSTPRAPRVCRRTLHAADSFVTCDGKLHLLRDAVYFTCRDGLGMLRLAWSTRSVKRAGEGSIGQRLAIVDVFEPVRRGVECRWEWFSLSNILIFLNYII